MINKLGNEGDLRKIMVQIVANYNCKPSNNKGEIVSWTVKFQFISHYLNWKREAEKWDSPEKWYYFAFFYDIPW